MNKLWAALACGLLALPATAAGPGTLTVDDRAKAFTADGVAKAKGLMEAAEFQAPTHLTVLTGGDADVPAAYKADFDAAKKNKDAKAGLRTLGDWAADEALKHADKGVFVLVYTQGDAVLVKVKADKTTDLARHFDTAADQKLADLLVKEFKAGKKDQGLYEATAFVVDKLKNTTVPTATAPAAGGGRAAQHQVNKGGFNVGSLICFGLLAVLAIWLVFGLIRAFTAPRGGYGPGGYGPGGYGGGGYGGGGGGFMSGLMGGLFGAVAGNYLYNNMFGGSSLGASGMDSGGYGGAGGYPDAAGGDGDYAGGSEAGAGDFGGGGGGYDDAGGGAGGFDDAGGGDFGGGGGDYGGGGGDFGGGGGDFGGGGGDW